MADALDQDVQALKAWLRTAWCYLADPALTDFERRELRNYMKEADAALRTGLQKLAVTERVRRERENNCPQVGMPDFRIFKMSDERRPT
jgi:hypothetical protein